MLRLAAIALVAACAPVPEPEVREGNWLLPGTSWRLVDLDGAPFQGEAVATLGEDGRVTGTAPCNAFTAAYSGRWPDIRFAASPTTATTCPQIAAETAFFDAMAQVTRGSLGDDGLTLTGPDTRLRFERL